MSCVIVWVRVVFRRTVADCWILQPYNIRVAHKPITTLQHTVVGRKLNTRLTEHKHATKNGNIMNHIAEHHRLAKHKMDWDSAGCVTYSTNYSVPSRLIVDINSQMKFDQRLKLTVVSES